MTDLTTPGEYGPSSTIDPTQTGNAFARLAAVPWVVNGADLSPDISVLDETQMNAFAITTSSSSFDVTIDAGEAYVGGWLCRDRATTVTLPASSTTSIFVGYDASATISSGTAPADNENIIIGPPSDFAAEDPKAHLYSVTTDGSGVPGTPDDYRILQQPISADQGDVSIATGLNVSGDTSINGSTNVAGTFTAQGDQILRRTQDWDGTSVVFETADGDTLEFVRE